MHNEKVYTPDYVCDYLALPIFGGDINNKHILDNSCGDGNILYNVVKKICERRNTLSIDLKEHLGNYIHGIDIDEVAIKKCIDRLNGLVSEYSITDVEWDIKVSNCLTNTEYDGNMDFVIGNPPYCKVHHLSPSDYDLLKEEYTFCKDSMTDLYLAFFEKGIKQLSPTGLLSYITPNSWLTSKAGKTFRDFLIESKKIYTIKDNKSLKLFDKATTFTCITFIDNAKDNDGIVYSYPDKNGKYITKVTGIDDMVIDGKFYINEPSDNKTIRDVITYKVQNNGEAFYVKNALCTLKDKLFILDNLDSIKTKSPYLKTAVKASTGNIVKMIYPYNKNGKPISFEQFDKPIQNYLIDKANSLHIDTEKSKDWFLYGRTQAIKDTYKPRVYCNVMVRDKEDIKCGMLSPGTCVYSGLYIYSDIYNDLEELYDKIKEALSHDLFTKYIRIAGKPKNGNYYTYSSKDIEQYLNYYYKN